MKIHPGPHDLLPAQTLDAKTARQLVQQQHSLARENRRPTLPYRVKLSDRGPVLIYTLKQLEQAYEAECKERLAADVTVCPPYMKDLAAYQAHGIETALARLQPGEAMLIGCSNSDEPPPPPTNDPFWQSLLRQPFDRSGQAEVKQDSHPLTSVHGFVVRLALRLPTLREDWSAPTSLYLLGRYSDAPQYVVETLTGGIAPYHLSRNHVRILNPSGNTDPVTLDPGTNLGVRSRRGTTLVGLTVPDPTRKPERKTMIRKPMIPSPPRSTVPAEAASIALGTSSVPTVSAGDPGVETHIVTAGGQKPRHVRQALGRLVRSARSLIGKNPNT